MPHRRNPIFHGDIPPRTDPLPKFFNDQDAAKLMKAARAHRLPRYRLVVEMLARTGMRASELCDARRRRRHPASATPIGCASPSASCAMTASSHCTQTSSSSWPPGRQPTASHIRAQKRLMADEHEPLDRRTVHRIVATTAKKAGIGAVHPHQLRHTLATQAINRGMRLEAIAAMLGHRSMEMTLTYARIADRVVADEYESVSAQIDALYKTAGASPGALPAEIETAAMTRLRQESHARMLGNGMCTRPVELECRMESACETCAYFRTGPEFVPVLLRQRDHARKNGQIDRADALREPGHPVIEEPA